jgi:hypothetical protein
MSVVDGLSDVAVEFGKQVIQSKEVQSAAINVVKSVGSVAAVTAGGALHIAGAALLPSITVAEAAATASSAVVGAATAVGSAVGGAATAVGGAVIATASALLPGAIILGGGYLVYRFGKWLFS